MANNILIISKIQPIAIIIPMAFLVADINTINTYIVVNVAIMVIADEKEFASSGLPFNIVCSTIYCIKDFTKLNK